MSSSYGSRGKGSVNFNALFKTEYPHSTGSTALNRRGHGTRVYVCLHCPDRWSAPIPSNAVAHAKRRHPELVQETQDSQASGSFTIPSTQGTISSFFSRVPTDSSLRNAFNSQQYNEAIVGLLTRRRIPFSAVEWDEMHSLVLAANPAIGDCLITSRYRAMKLIDANYDLYASQLKEELQESQSMIHILTDLWTSPHRHGMLAVCAQWVDKSHSLRKALLGIPECQFSHSGEAQAALIMDVLHSFSISKVGYHVGDNATSNDTCLESLAIRLKAELEVCYLLPRRARP